MPSFTKLSRTIREMADCVLNWHEFTFEQCGHEYRVLGGVIGEDTEGHPVLYADLLAIDGQPQTNEPLMRFDLSGSKSPVRRGALRGRCSNDYTGSREALTWTYAVGPIGRRKSLEGSGSRSESERRSEARRRIEALFKH